MSQSPVRVRIAPSPTGKLHIGTARTALFNYLFAKHAGGQFILRIEDTDLLRSQEEYVTNIFDGLRLLGIQWDEGPDAGGPYAPYRQTERLSIYEAHIQKLIAEGKAFCCYCTQAELDAERERRKQQNPDDQGAYVYSGRCRDANVRDELTNDPSRKSVVRFRVPDNRGEIVVHDCIRGDITFEASRIGDFVIKKSPTETTEATPTYTLCNVVDDALMKITHVIRGEDLLPNTPNQILLYEAFGWPTPQFAHLSLILAPDRTKLSKRHGATSVAEFIEQGYLPEAICNFLATLGWSSPSGTEEASLEFFAKEFTLERVSNSPAVFDIEKLKNLNGRAIRALDPADLLNRVRPFLTAFDLHQYNDDKLRLMMDAVRKPLTLLSDFPEAVIYFFGLNVMLDAQLVGEVLTGEEPTRVLTRFQSDVIDKADWNSADDLGAKVHDLAEALKPLKTKQVMQPIRAAVTGRTSGADLSKVLYILGKEAVTHRIKTALTLTTGQAAV